MNKRFRIVRITAFLLALIFFVCAPIFFIPNISGGKTLFNVEKKGIIELWHIESFEGGSASRVDWLRARAREFENKNKGVYVHITLLTATQAKNMIGKQHFDLLSFSLGLSSDVIKYLAEYSGAVFAEDNFAVGGVFCGAQYAAPYMTGGYFLFSKTSELDKTKPLGEIFCGSAEFISPVVAAALNNIKIDCDATASQYKAYERFVVSKGVLLGTQRDEFRLGNRLNNGAIDALSAVALGGFTDLVQYLSIASDCVDYDIAVDFIEFLTSEAAQAKLIRCNMLSVCGVDVYKSGFMADLQRALASARTPNVFWSEKTVGELRLLGASGDVNEITKFLDSGSVYLEK